MMKWVFIIGLVGLGGVAHANEEAPRKRYLNQMCHNSTASVIKDELRAKTKDINRFCECVATDTLSKMGKPEDHTYALAHHEANIMINRHNRYDRPLLELSSELGERSAGYETDFGISFQDLNAYFATAIEDMVQCQKKTPSKHALSLRGVFPAL